MSVFIKLQPSYFLSVVLLLGYILAILTVLMLPVVLLAKVAITFLLLSAAAYYCCRDAWLLLPTSVIALRMRGNEVTLVTRGGEEISGQVSGDSFVTPVLTILNIFRSGRIGRHSVVILPDSLDKESFRELRVSLKWTNLD